MPLHLHPRKTARAHSVCSSRAGHSPQMPIYDTSLGKTLHKSYPRNFPTRSCWFVQDLRIYIRVLIPSQLGPFVDSSHPRIKNGDVDETPEQLFTKHFAEKIADILAEKPSILFFVVPSVSDVLSEHASFPQCEFDTSLLSHSVRAGPNRVHIFLNSTLSTFACSLIRVDSPSTASNLLSLRWMLCSTSRKRNS